MSPEYKPQRQRLLKPSELGEDTASYWEAAAPTYLRHIEGDTGGDGRMIRDKVLHPRILTHLGDVRNARIADIGGGDGILSRLLIHRGARPVNGDFMHHLLRASVSGRPSVPSVQMRATETLPLADASFDRAVSNLVLMWMPDISTIASETYRVLKPGGRYVVSVTHPMVNLGTFDVSDPKHPMLKLQASLQNGTWLKMINGTNGPYPYYQRSPSEYVNAFTKEKFRLVPETGYEDVFFSRQFVTSHPEYLKHLWYPLFLILAFEK